MGRYLVNRINEKDRILNVPLAPHRYYNGLHPDLDKLRSIVTYCMEEGILYDYESIESRFVFTNVEHAVKIKMKFF